MFISVINIRGDQIKLSPQINSALAALGLEADTPGADWDEVTHKMIRLLAADDFEITKLQPEVDYYDTKKGKKILEIKIHYSA
jgi:hypothetical protein